MALLFSYMILDFSFMNFNNLFCEVELVPVDGEIDIEIEIEEIKI